MASLGNVEKYTTEMEGLAQGDGAVEIEVDSWRANTTQVSFNYADNTDDLGTLAVHIKYHPKAAWEVLLDEAGSPRTITLSAAGLRSFELKETFIHALRFTPTAVTGTYDVYIYQDSPEDLRQACK